MLAAAISTQQWNDFQASSHEGCRERSVRLGERDGVSSRYSCRGGGYSQRQPYTLGSLLQEQTKQTGLRSSPEISN